MPDSTINAVLSPSEWRLVQSVRNVPAGALHDRAAEVIESLLFYVNNPRCAGMGVEGFACGEPKSTCEECQAIWDLLDTIAERCVAVK